MVVNGLTIAVAAVIGLAVGAFATGQVGGVVLPLLFVLACPLMVLFLRASTDRPGGAGTPGGTAEPREPARDDAPRAGARGR